MWELWDCEHCGFTVALCVAVVAAKLAIDRGRAAKADGTEPSSAACDNPKWVYLWPGRAACDVVCALPSSRLSSPQR